MKRISIILLSIAITSFSSCVFSKKSTDITVSRFLERNTAMVKEAAEFAVLATYKSSHKNFLATDVEDKDMREKIASLGASVTVSYDQGSNYEIPDSNVTFKSITIFGVTEVIYDFAASTRDFSENTKNRRAYYFIKVADRIYYRRREVPMM